VGDAGYFKDPLGTHGMSQALRDAELLSHAVLDAAYDDRPLKQALSSYERSRDGLSAGMFAATDALASYDWDSAEVERLLRQLSTEMSREVDTVAAFTGTGTLRSRTA
jgi:2-polyprenyl-6-methoxyphenol hydroxylase-like FAD-dependent oxidoreductase